MPKTIGYSDHFHGGYDTFTAGETGGPIFLERQMLADVSKATFDIPSNVYTAYTWRIYNICGKSDNINLTWQANEDENVSITSSAFRAYINAAGDDAGGPGYQTSQDQANGTSYQQLQNNIGYEPEESCSAHLTIFDPSSDTFVKQFIGESTTHMSDAGSKHDFNSGYLNTTSPITQIHFKLSSGNIKSGTIAMYGIL